MYLTGVLSHAANLKHIDNSQHHLLTFEKNTQSTFVSNKNLFLAGHLSHNMDAYKLWDKLRPLKYW